MEDICEVLSAELEIEKPCIVDVKRALKKMKSNKAPGGDGITSELIKKGELHVIIKKIWEEEKVPVT